MSPSSLAYFDKVVGSCPKAVKGQLIRVHAHYVGKLVNGKVFDSSYDRGKPLSFRIGVGRGSCIIIPPASVLLFDVEFIGKA